MSWIAKETGGVRITFDNALVTESRLWCEYSFPNLATPLPDVQQYPLIYWESNVKVKTKVEQTGYIFLAPGTEWIRFFIEFDQLRGVLYDEARQVSRNANRLAFKVLLRSDLTDPQLHRFGERTYKYTYRKGLQPNPNAFLLTPSSGLPPDIATPTPPPGNMVRMHAIFYPKVALQKDRKIFLRDIKGRPFSENRSLEALIEKYPPGPGENAPWSLVSAASPQYQPLLLAYNSSGYWVSMTGNITNGWIAPMNTLAIRLEQLVMNSTIQNSLQAQVNAGYTQATKLFDEFQVLSEDYGNWAPLFLGKELTFIETPLEVKATYV